MTTTRDTSTSYAKVVKGKLKFKGDARPPKSKKRSLEEILENQNGTNQTTSGSKIAENDIQIQTGTGRITSSGTTIHGHYTDFMSQLSVGDAIIITHPTTLQEETKIIRMVLSNVSISISSPFSSDLISTTPFRYIKAPKDTENEEEKQLEETKKKHKAEENAFGTYASQGGTKFTYRVKKDGAFGGYKIVSESTHSEMSREELLNMRAKKKSDRHCY